VAHEDRVPWGYGAEVAARVAGELAAGMERRIAYWNPSGAGVSVRVLPGEPISAAKRHCGFNKLQGSMGNPR